MKDIHITDMETFADCRRRWDFSSLMRMGLQRQMIPKPLFVGQAEHVGLDAYYKNGRNIYAAVARLREWIKRRAEGMAALSGPLWDEEREQINESYALAVGMLKHYALWAPKWDKRFEVIDTERVFRVPIPVPADAKRVGYSHLLRQGCYRDRHGQLVSGVIQLVGRFDGLLLDKETNHLWLLEFKTARSLETAHWAMRGMQGSAYVYGAQWLYGQPVEGIIYRILCKRVPSRPEPLKSGGYSQRQKQKTSLEYIRHRLDIEAKQTGVSAEQLYLENEKLLRELASRRTPEGNDFFLQRKIHKPQSVIDDTMRTVYYEGLQMADPNVPVFANPGWSSCNNCGFRDPCDLIQMGLLDQAMALLDAEYAARTYWEGVNGE